MTVEIRSVEPAEFDAYYRAESAGFGEHVSQAEIDAERGVAEVDRSMVVVDPHHDDRVVGTCTAFSFEMTVPGGSRIAVGGSSGVTVAVTHRRQGILREMMRRQLDGVVERGEVGAVLMASQASIYGRFGYGVATRHARYEIDTTRPVELDRPPVGRTLRVVDRDEAAARFPALHDAWAGGVPGAIRRSGPWWPIALGATRHWKGGGPLWFVLAGPVPDEEDPGGYVVFELEERSGELMKRLVIRELHAPHPETAAALWRLCLDHDMATSVVAPVAPLDEAVGWRLADPRALRTTAVSDFLWLRLVDVEAALSTRGYRVDGALTLSITDSFRPDVAGTYRLQVTDGIGRCRRVEPSGSAASGSADRVDIELDIADLGSLYLGGVTATTLAAAGRAAPCRPGAAALADALFAHDRQPFCDTFF